MVICKIYLNQIRKSIDILDALDLVISELQSLELWQRVQPPTRLDIVAAEIELKKVQQTLNRIDPVQHIEAAVQVYEIEELS